MSEPNIGDYALIGNCRSAALVSRDGSVDWLCWPRYDSPSLFGALLDARRGGRFSIRPVGSFSVSRRYVPSTNVLETRFETSSGRAVLRDCLSVAAPDQQHDGLLPEHELLRQLECAGGEIELEVVYEPRPAYGRVVPRLRSRGSLGLWLQHRGAAITLRNDPELHLLNDGGSAAARVRLRNGERHFLALTYDRRGPAVLPVLGPAAHERFERTIAYWRNWADSMTYTGDYRESVVRSALVLKLMTYAPSGAVIAAPTTSLPERLGGTLNWDYRYCWLRDASLVLRALFSLGYHSEATAFVSWMLQATRLTWPKLQVLYDIFGESHLPETRLQHLTGFAGSRPVRVGNAAWRQTQLDVYGELIDAAARFIEAGGQVDARSVRLLDDLGQTVCRCWRQPDAGIWESRGPMLQHTHSKVMCWVALDRLVRLHEAGHIDVHVNEFRAERDAIRDVVEQHGYNSAIQSYTSTLDGIDVGANLLLLPIFGYVSADDPRMCRTIDLVLQRLARGCLVSRYASRDWRDDQGEGAFGASSFWAVSALALSGRRDAATQRFECLLRYSNDVGLFGEEIDTETGGVLGNFPQPFTHVALINAALTLQACSERREVVGER